MAWTSVAKPVEYGGLGIIELSRFSRALRIRWLWFRWSSPERPWNGSELSVDAEDMALFNAATAVTVRNGLKASFWNSSWIDGRPPSSLCPLLYKQPDSLQLPGFDERHQNASSSFGHFFKIGCGQQHAYRYEDGKTTTFVRYVKGI